MTIETPRLKALWRVSVGAGFLAFLLALAWAWTETGFDWIWWVAAFGLAAIVYNVVFFALCSWRAPGLAGFISSEDTKVEGDNVVIETTHTQSGDEALDFYVRAYMHARGASYTAISAVILIGVALAIYFFS